MDYILSFSSEKLIGPAHFLDAGCGTGSSVIGAALFQPDLMVYGCDFNAESLKQIEPDLEDLQLKNVRLRQVDLLDFPEDFGPAEGFDVIFCTGVIHHTADPLKILRSLAARLAPQGVLRLMVYAQRGRSELYRFAEVVQSLLQDVELPLEVKLEKASKLLRELQQRGAEQAYPVPSLRGLLEDSHRISAIEFADRYLHPHDSPYTLSLLREHIQAAGLRFLSWFEDRHWDLNELLPNQAVRGDFPQEPWERFEIVEELFDRDQYDLYLVGPQFQARQEAFTYDCPLRVNPQVNFTATTFRGLPKSQEAKLLFYPPETLSYEQGKIMLALSRRTATLRELLSEWGVAESKEWFQGALYLLFRNYLYRPRLSS